MDRARSPLAWPQLFIFAEGTTTNGRHLARFRTGGFQPGLPLQPVTIQYSRPDLCVWTKLQDHRLLHSLLLIFAYPFHEVTLEFLPVYKPSEEEKSDAVLFARNVQQLMADHLKVSATDFQREQLNQCDTKKKE